MLFERIDARRKRWLQEAWLAEHLMICGALPLGWDAECQTPRQRRERLLLAVLPVADEVCATSSRRTVTYWQAYEGIHGSKPSAPVQEAA